MMRRILPPVFCLALLCGCQNRILWEYRDDPYLEQFSHLGEDECLNKSRSIYFDDRQLALRSFAERAAIAREKGDAQAADRLVQILLDRYERERDERVRATIIRICAPVCGMGSKRVEMFLRRAIAEGEWADEAVLSLAAIDPENAFELIAPMVEHPDIRMRYAAAIALTNLGDRRGVELVKKVIQGMGPGEWREERAEPAYGTALANLKKRAERIWPGVGFAKTAPVLNPAEILPEIETH